MDHRLQLQEATAVALDAENRALRAEARVADCEREVEELRARFEQLLRRAESQEAELAEVHHEAIAANARCDALAAELRQRDAAGGDRDGAVATQNGGAVAFLGLRVSSHRDEATGAVLSGCVVVDEVRGPAAAAGVRPGDRLQHVAVAAEWPIDSVRDYRQCVVDLPLDGRVTVTVTDGDGGESRTLEMRPESLRLPDASSAGAESASAARRNTQHASHEPSRSLHRQGSNHVT
jgi:hypothetical protein